VLQNNFTMVKAIYVPEEAVEDEEMHFKLFELVKCG
jgi:hypothetical protein